MGERGRETRKVKKKKKKLTALLTFQKMTDFENELDFYCSWDCTFKKMNDV
jgi:hypothetical protein